MAKQNVSYVLLVSVLLIVIGCNRDIDSESQTAQMEIQLSHTAAGLPLQFNTEVTTPNNEPIRYTVCKYFIGQLQLIDRDSGIQSLGDTYYLIDAASAATQNLRLQIPAGNYKAIQFTLGVDSARNVSGVQEGALDPANGMFWTWNSGYIMFKLEGKSSVSPAPLGNVTYHIGGFRQQDNVLRTMQLDFGQTLSVGKNNNLRLNIAANIDKWWTGANSIKIGDGALIMEPGTAAMKIADNYASMFSLISAANE